MVNLMVSMTEQDKQLILTLEKKSDVIQILLSVFLLPFALLYSRGIVGWMKSIILTAFSGACWLIGMVIFIPRDQGGVAAGAGVTGIIIVSVVYFIYAITDASRVNKQLLKKLIKNK